MNIKPIETHYKGYRFRSRLEARWAVFFDELGWDWEYEFEGYELPSGRYLPDFWFPKIKCFGEVKPENLSELEFTKCSELTELNRVILLTGVPDFKAYRIIEVGEGQHHPYPDTFVFQNDGSKYYPFFWSSDYSTSMFPDVDQAITEARSKRFEFNGK